MLKEKIASEFKDKKVLILGFGREGKATYDFLKANNINCKVTIADKNEEVEPLEQVNLCLGEQYIKSVYSDYDIIMKSPGISFKQLDISKIKAKITSQTELLLKYGKDKIIGVTGTKGKSTTATLLYNILKQKYCVKLIGNIGVPPFTAIEEWEQTDYFVYELSCHQLEKVKYSPKIAVFLNIFEEHLDHYESYEQYIDAKRNIFKHQEPSDIFLFNEFFAGKIVANNVLNQVCIALRSEELFGIYEQNSEIRETEKTNSDNYASIDKNIISLSLNNSLKRIELPLDIKGLIGVHNYYNAMVTVIVAELLGVEHDKIFSALKEFKGLDHRLQYIGTYNGVDYIDDSISTIPEATINGVTSVANVQTVIIGGMDRGIDYSNLRDFLAALDVKNIILMYETGKLLYDILNSVPNMNNIVYVKDLDEAVRYAVANTPTGSVCLLSPAAASYGYFKNFEDRGTKFKEYIIKYTK